MTDERAVRMAMETAALVAAIRRYVLDDAHASDCGCHLCRALAVYDRREAVR